MMEEVLEVGISEDEVKEILDDHGNRIIKLEIDTATTKEKMCSLENQMADVKGTLVRFENNYLQTTNSMMGVLSQVVLNTSDNATKIVTASGKNKTQVTLKILAIVGGVISTLLIGYFAAKYGVTIPAIK